MEVLNDKRRSILFVSIQLKITMSKLQSLFMKKEQCDCRVNDFHFSNFNAEKHGENYVNKI